MRTETVSVAPEGAAVLKTGPSVTSGQGHKVQQVTLLPRMTFGVWQYGSYRIAAFSNENKNDKLSVSLLVGGAEGGK